MIDLDVVSWVISIAAVVLLIPAALWMETRRRVNLTPEQRRKQAIIDEMDDRNGLGP